MARYTDTQIFAFNTLVDSRLIVVSGGDVSVNAWDGNSWVLSDILTIGTKEMFTKGARLQFVPAGGASYYIEESDR